MGSEEKRRGSKNWKVEVSLKVAIYGTDPRTGPGNICFGFLFLYRLDSAHKSNRTRKIDKWVAGTKYN